MILPGWARPVSLAVWPGAARAACARVPEPGWRESANMSQPSRAAALAAQRLPDAEEWPTANPGMVRTLPATSRRYPVGVNSGATTICPRDVVASRISFTGW